MDRDKVSTAEVRLSGLGWIRIEWDTPVSKEHADLALAEAVSPSRLQPSGDVVPALVWLGYWRDQIPPEAVSQLQDIIQSSPSYSAGYAKAIEDSAAKAESMAPVTSNHAAYTIAAAIRALAGKDEA